VTGIPEKIRESSELYHDVTHVGTLSIAVKDSGAGLSPQQLAEICAEGVQFNANELQAGQGSGLGLFISKGIAEQHGGKLVVESEGLGKGVTFTAELPLFRRRPVSESMRSLASRRSRSESLNSERTSAMPMMNHISSSTSSAHTVSIERAVAAAATAAGIVAPCRLLVVDDSMLNRKMMIRLLSSKDHVCEQAEDGEAGIRKYLEMVERGEPPDAILMDYEMPVMNGPSATARLRELGCTCLIVGVTGNVLPHDRAFFIAHGANGVLPKPIVLEEFEQLLAGSLLRLSQQHQTQHQHQPQQHQHQHQREQQQGGSAYAAEVTAGFALSEKPPAKSASMTLSTTAKIHPEQLV
jgi:CheY-like chemotaxis protein